MICIFFQKHRKKIILKNLFLQIILQVAGNEALALETSNTQQVTMETRRVTTETKKEFHKYAATFSESSRDTGSSNTSVAQTYSYTPSTQTLASSQWQPPVSASLWQQPMTSSPRPPPTTSVTWYYHPHF